MKSTDKTKKISQMTLPELRAALEKSEQNGGCRIHRDQVPTKYEPKCTHALHLAQAVNKIVPDSLIIRDRKINQEHLKIQERKQDLLGKIHQNFGKPKSQPERRPLHSKNSRRLPALA